MTASPQEIQDLDQGRHRGWSRTGQAFLAHAPGSSIGSSQPVCRFYGLPSAGLDSHFYSAHRQECDEVAVRFPHAWQIEATNVFEAPLPLDTTARCQPDTVPVYRLWNQRIDSNHRYTINLAARDAMISKGFLAEGIAPDGVVMCAIAPSLVSR